MAVRVASSVLDRWTGPRVCIGTAGELSALQYSEGSRLLVPKPDEAAIREMVEAVEAGDAEAPVSDAELAELADDAAGWSDPGSGAVV